MEVAHVPRRAALKRVERQLALLSRSVVTPLSPAQPTPRLRLSRSPPVQPQAGSYWLPCYLTLLAQLVRLHSVAMIVQHASEE